MFLRILTKSLRHRGSRILVAVLAVTMGASLAAAALSVSIGMEEKVGRTLRAYGANIVLVPKSAALGLSDATLKESDLLRLRQLDSSLLGYAPFLYAVVESGDQVIALGGTQFDAATRVNAWWKIEGNAPANDDRVSAIVGANVAAKWRVKIGDEIAVAAAGASGGYRNLVADFDAPFRGDVRADDRRHAVVVRRCVPFNLPPRVDACRRVELGASQSNHLVAGFHHRIEKRRIAQQRRIQLPQAQQVTFL